MSEALDKFVASADYPKILAGLVGKAVVTGNEKVVVSKNDKTLNQAWLDGINKANKTKLAFASSKGNFKGGVILQEGEAYVNITVETLFSVIREDTESEIAKILFKDA
jgi:V/A-type H+-transporting ATPase subunit E